MKLFPGFNPRLFVIGAILACGLFLRLPQLNFPSIGYHNMKENEYISMAKHMLETGDLISRQVYFYNAFDKKSDFNLYPQVPFVSYQILAGYKLFGDNLWFPRLVNILLMLGAFLCLYRIAGLLKLGRAPRLALLFLLAVMPLGVFFARNLQADSGAFFFMCAGNVLGLQFLRGNKRVYLVLFSLALAVTAAYKLAFLIGFIPIFLLIPLKPYLRKRGLKGVAADFFILSVPLAAFVLYCFLTGQSTFSEAGNRVQIFRPFTPAYWQEFGPTIWHYLVNENFTLVYFVLCVAGLIFVWLGLRKDKSPFARYLRIWSILLIPYLMIFGDYVNQHNYYQMPFLGLVVFVVVYALDKLSRWSGEFLHSAQHTKIFTVLFIVTFLFALPGIRSAIISHFLVIYPGADTTGLYLKQVMPPEEKFFIYTTSQGYAPCVYAQRRCGWPEGIEEFKRIEREENIRYIAVYPFAYLNRMPPEIKEYVMGSYHVELMGFLADGSSIIPQALVLRKGGMVNIDAFIKENLPLVKLETVYRTVRGNIPFYTITQPLSEP